MADVFEYVYESERVQELLIEVSAGLCNSGPGIPEFTDVEQIAVFISDTENYFLNRVGACIMAVTAYPYADHTPAQRWAYVDGLLSTTDDLAGLVDVQSIFANLIVEWDKLQDDSPDAAVVALILEFFAERAKRREIESMVESVFD